MAVPFLAIRMGSVGVMACLLDWGAVAQISSRMLDAIGDLVLHPVQFQEAAALYALWRTRLNRVPKYLVIGGNGEADRLVTLPLGGMSGFPIFDDFDPETFAHLLSAFTGFDLDRIWYQDTEQLWSSLHTPDGKPLQMPNIEGAAIEPPRI